MGYKKTSTAHARLARIPRVFASFVGVNHLSCRLSLTFPVGTKRTGQLVSDYLIGGLP